MFDINKIFIDKEEIKSLSDDARQLIGVLRECLDIMDDGKDFYKVMQAYNVINSMIRFHNFIYIVRDSFVATGRLIPEINQTNDSLKNWIEDECPHPAFTTENELKERKQLHEKTQSVAEYIGSKIKELTDSSKETDKVTTNLH